MSFDATVVATPTFELASRLLGSACSKEPFLVVADESSREPVSTARFKKQE